MRARQITARNMVLCNLFITGEGEKKKKKQSEVKKKQNKKKEREEESTEQNTCSHYSWKVRKTVIRAAANF